MNIQSDNTKHCRSCGITLHRDSYHKHIKSEKQFFITGEQTN